MSPLNGVSNKRGLAVYGGKMKRVKKNSMIITSYAPIVHAVGSSIRISHREFITDVITDAVAGVFNVNQMKINPGIRTVFPWLSGIARQFQQFEIKGMVFEYRPTSSDALNSTNTALGDVILSLDYNAATVAPENKFVMLNEEGNVSVKPSRGAVIPVECDRSQSPVKVLYIRGDDVPTGQDARLFDFASLNVATVGGQAGSIVVGELWVSYDVILLKPFASNIQEEFAYTAVYDLAIVAVDARDGGILLGAAKTFDNIGIDVEPSTITFPRNVSGKFLIEIIIYGDPEATSPPSVNFTNAVGCKFLLNKSSYVQWAPDSGITATVFSHTLAVELTNPGVTSSVLYGVNGAYPSTSWGTVIITRMAHSFDNL